MITVAEQLLERGAIPSGAGTLWAPCPWCGVDLALTYDPATDRGWCTACRTRLVTGDMGAELERLAYRGPARRRGLARVVGVLLGCNVPVRLVAELAVAWGLTKCTPPMHGNEALAVVEFVASKELKRRGGDHAKRD